MTMLVQFVTFYYLIKHCHTADGNILQTSAQADTLDESLTKCILNVFTKHLVETESVATSLDSDDNRTTDRILLDTIHKEAKWSLYGLRPGEMANSLVPYTTIHNYLIQIRGVGEIKKDIASLKEKSWNPQGKFVIFANKLYKENEHILTHVFKKLWAQKALNTIVLLPQEKDPASLNIYSWFPYNNSNCGTYNESTLIDVCKNGTLQRNRRLFQRKVPKNLNGCPVRVRTIIWPPYVQAPKSYNRSQVGINFTHGLEIQLLNTIAKAANFNVVYTLSKIIQDWGYIMENGTSTGIFKAILDEQVDIGISSLAATVNRFIHFEPSLPYTTESLTWCVPSAIPKPKWLNVFNVFEILTWILTYVTFLALCVSMYRVARAENESTAYKRKGNCFMNMYAVFCGLSVKIKPSKWTVRTVFYMCSVLNFVIGAVYQTSLISFLTQPAYEDQITTVEQIFDNRLQVVYMLPTKLYFSFDTTDWRMQSILKTMTVCDDAYECIHDIAHMRNYTMATPRLFLQYIADTLLNRDGHSLVYWFKQDMMSFPVQMFMTKGFPLKARINSLISQIMQTGLLDKWQKDLRYVINKENMLDSASDDGPQYLSLSQLQGAFFILVFGNVLATLLFFLELIYHRRKRMINKTK